MAREVAWLVRTTNQGDRRLQTRQGDCMTCCEQTCTAPPPCMSATMSASHLTTSAASRHLQPSACTCGFQQEQLHVFLHYMHGTRPASLSMALKALPLPPPPHTVALMGAKTCEATHMIPPPPPRWTSPLRMKRHINPPKKVFLLVLLITHPRGGFIGHNPS